MNRVQCPGCAGTVAVDAEDIRCESCDRRYPRFGRIPIVLREPESFLNDTRHALAALAKEADISLRLVDAALQTSVTVPLTRIRCERMADAIRVQFDDVAHVLEPLLAPAVVPVGAAPTGVVPPPLTYIHYLYRDWGAPQELGGELAQTISLVDAVHADRSLGAMLVPGAGACGLPYHLHARDRTAETVAIDIDPFVFTVAEKVIRGDAVALTEASVDATELDRVSKTWELRATTVDRGRFHFLFADALAPPCAAASFDTVLTSWFIDLVPRDLSAFVDVVGRLLKPDGWWINVGPLRYPNDIPLRERFSREELFALLDVSGFTVDTWRTASIPYLVSRTTRRGRIEWVLAFAARKRR